MSAFNVKDTKFHIRPRPGRGELTELQCFLQNALLDFTLYSRISYTNSIKSRQLIVVIELSKCNLIVMYITQFT